MNRTLVFRILLVGMMIFLAACSSRTPQAATPTAFDANAVFTAAAQTANVRMTEIAAQTPSPMPATDTPPPPTATTAPTLAPVTATTAPTTGSSSGPDVAVYIADVTIPDGTDVTPGQQFVKTWRIQNGGTTRWTTAYALVFTSGAQMGTTTQVALTKEVAPGENVEISVNLTAPSTTGTQTGYWKMRNSNGQFFESSIYVQVDVVGSGTAAATTTGTVGPTLTATTGPVPTATTSSSVVSGVVMDVDQASYTGSCPHIFVFTAQFTLALNATVTYNIEAETGYPLTLPPQKTEPLDAGTHTVVYQLELSSNASGWARLHISSPAEITSNRVDFSLTCQ